MAYGRVKDENYRNLGGINTIVSTYTTEETQFLNLRNYCFVRPGSLTSRPGQEYHVSLSRATFLVKPANTMELIRQDGSTYVVYDVGPTLYKLPNTALGGGLVASATLSAPIDSESINNALYMANGNTFRVFDGTDVFNYTSETTRFDDVNLGITFNTSLIPNNSVTAVIASGLYYFWLTPVRTASGSVTQYGLPTNLNTLPNVPGVGDQFGIMISLSATVVAMGKWVVWGFTLAAEYGYSSVAVQYQKYTSITTTPYSNNVLNSLKSDERYAFGLSSFGGVGDRFGFSFDHFTLSADWENQFRLSASPKYLEVYNNMMFLAGFTATPNQVLYSEIGEPQRIKEENFFEIKTADNKKISGMIFFQDSLVIFKRSSVHELVGTSPQDLTLRTTTLEYGALNNEGLVVFENKLWFVDEKGICEYNAANTQIVSEPINEYLNLVDKEKIKAVHYKERSEVWFCADNKCFIYDYFAKAWTIYDNVPIDYVSGGNVLPIGTTTSNPVYWRTGESFHSFAKFNPTLSDDFGVAITLVAQTRYHKRMGESTQELWRRLFINADVPSVTTGVTINFRPDYGSSISLTKSLELTQFQKRVDFGVSAKSLSAEFIIQSLSSIRVNGYTLESRYLRNV
jgi:hypothetical protein